MQEIILDGNIKLLDCPGVVYSDYNTNIDKQCEIILNNVIRNEDVKDPIGVVNVILKKVTKENIVEIYKISPDSVWETTEQFLYLIGDKMKKYKKGGIIDFDKTARLLIKDWNDGKIKYYTNPPFSAEDMVSSDVQMQTDI